MNLQQNTKPAISILIILFLIASFAYITFPSHTCNTPLPPLTNSKMGIIHIVMFEFKPEVTPEEISDVRTTTTFLN
jgi:hypothetical protein